MDPTLSTAALASLEALCHRALALDPASELKLRALAGQSLRLHSSAPAYAIDIHLQDGDSCLRLSAVTDDSPSPTACLRGSAVAMFALLLGEQYSLADSGVELLGNSALLSTLQGVFKHLELDWESLLVEGLGDVLGHQVAESLRHKVATRRTQAQSLVRMLGDYVVEERRLALGRFEFDSFANQVDVLRADVERAEAKLAQSAVRLQALLSRQGGPRA